MKSILAAILGFGLLFYAAAPTAISQTVQQSANMDEMAPMVLNGYSRFPRNIGYCARL